MTKTELLKRASQEINKVLEVKTQGQYFTSPGKRALVWFKCYEALYRFGESGGYSISRTEARHALSWFGLDLDQMLTEADLT